MAWDFKLNVLTRTKQEPSDTVTSHGSLLDPPRTHQVGPVQITAENHPVPRTLVHKDSKNK